MRSTSLDEIRLAGKSIARDAGASAVKAYFEANRDAMAAVLPAHVSPDRMMRIALSAARTTPKLLQATTESLMGAVMVCSQLGLEPNTPLGHVYLIPFENRRSKKTEIQIVIGYRGLLDLARRSGKIKSISAHAVYQRDEFEFEYGSTQFIKHKPAISRDDGRGLIVAFYAVAHFVNGGHEFEVMSKSQVDAIRDKSNGYKAAKRDNGDHPWISSYEEMGRKTAIRRLSKVLPMSIEFATAINIDGRSTIDAVMDANSVEFITQEHDIDDEGSDKKEGNEAVE